MDEEIKIEFQKQIEELSLEELELLCWLLKIFFCDEF